MTEALERLAADPFTADLPDAARRAIAPHARDVAFAAGDFLLREGDDARVFYVVVSGSVSLETHAPGRPPVRLETVLAGTVLGLSWIFPGSRVHLDARAIDAVRAIAFDAAAVRAAMDADPNVGWPIARKLMRVMFDRLERVRLQRLDVYGGET